VERKHPTSAAVELYWLPLGAGGHVVRWNGRVYEWWAARRERRPRADLYHCGLMLSLGEATYAIEMGPVWNVPDGDRGVLTEGPVGSRVLGRFRAFRYELRCWRGGTIPDIGEAVDSPVRTTDDPARVAAVLDVLPEIPALTWGRDELGTGEMWNSNSAVSWALARSGHDMAAIGPPRGGRAPGWTAGLVLAARQAQLVGRSASRPGTTGYGTEMNPPTESEHEPQHEPERKGQVSEVASFGTPGEQISPGDAVAGAPDGESGEVDEGPTGPDATTYADRQDRHPDKDEVQGTD
jgi:hypothetical protein